MPQIQINNCIPLLNFTPDTTKLIIDVKSIYLFGETAETKIQRKDLLNCFDNISIFLDDEEPIAVQWLLSTTNNCRKHIKECIDQGNKDVARQYFERAICRNNRLSEFIKKKHYVS